MDTRHTNKYTDDAKKRSVPESFKPSEVATGRESTTEDIGKPIVAPQPRYKPTSTFGWVISSTLAIYLLYARFIH
jgi:hypothetical protein